MYTSYNSSVGGVTIKHTHPYNNIAYYITNKIQLYKSIMSLMYRVAYETKLNTKIYSNELLYRVVGLSRALDEAPPLFVRRRCCCYKKQTQHRIQ